MVFIRQGSLYPVLIISANLYVSNILQQSMFHGVCVCVAKVLASVAKGCEALEAPTTLQCCWKLDERTTALHSLEPSEITCQDSCSWHLLCLNTAPFSKGAKSEVLETMFLTVENFVDCIHFPTCPIPSGTARTFPHISTAAIWNLRASRKYGNKKRGERQEDEDSVNYVCREEWSL